MLIILDRDGVINHDSDDYIKCPDEWIAIDGSLSAIARLKKAGHQVVVATNQSGVGRGYYTQQVLDQIHLKMQQQLAEFDAQLDGIYFCPHTPDHNCDCRKPKPGLLYSIANDFDSDLSGALVVGDSYRDIQAAQAANCPAALVETGKGERQLAQHPELAQVPRYNNLSHVADDILQRSGS